jgi:hypothetical protein
LSQWRTIDHPADIFECLLFIFGKTPLLRHVFSHPFYTIAVEKAAGSW